MFRLDNLTVIGICCLKGYVFFFFLNEHVARKLYALFFTSFHWKNVTHPGQNSVSVTSGCLQCTLLSDPWFTKLKVCLCFWYRHAEEVKWEPKGCVCVASCVVVRQCCLTRRDSVILGTLSCYVKWVLCFMAASRLMQLHNDLTGSSFSALKTLLTYLAGFFF